MRLFERMQGRVGGADLGEDAVAAFAATRARLTLALRGFFHPAAGRDLLWNPAQAPPLRSLAASIPDAGRRGIVERVLERFEARVLRRWDDLPAQVAHGDFTLDNVFLDERDYVAGNVDFGDISFTARAGDFAIDVVSLLRGQPADDVFRIARIAIDGYSSRIPLEDEELDVLGDLVAAPPGSSCHDQRLARRALPGAERATEAEDHGPRPHRRRRVRSRASPRRLRRTPRGLDGRSSSPI